MNWMNQKNFDFQIKNIESSGTFTGYGSVFNTADQSGEIVACGAFSDSLRETASKGRKLPILWQHQHSEPIGVYDHIEEDSHGLLMKGRLLVDHVQRAKEAHELLKAGAVTGLSIGYLIKDHAYDEKTGIMTLKKLDLKETSLVTFPMHDDARINAIKAIEMIIKSGELPTLPEFENFLRDAGGFSKSQATIIASYGFREMIYRSDSDSEFNSCKLSALRNYTLSKD